MRNSTKPTDPRITIITIEPLSTDGECSSISSAGVASSRATTSADRNVDGHQSGGEQEGGVDQRSLAAGRRELDERRRDHGGEADDAGDQPELGVGLDEIALAAHDGRDERRLAHDVRLLQHERREHDREQRQVVDDGDHQQAQTDAAGRRRP